MTWFAFANDGNVYDLNGFAEKELVATFAHGYGTEAEAWAKKNLPANPAQATMLATFISAASSPSGGGVQGVIQVVTVDASGKVTGKISPTNNPATNAAKGVIKSAAGDWLSGLTNWIGQPNIWVRGAEIIAGLMVLYIGLKAVTAPPGASVGSIGKQTVKHTVKNVRRVATHT